ncbi:MAG: S-methyl-5-thioribose-1-phosphate isomerase [Oligoflexia bacterium]|nr:S-methyl-5-thioribose-1-phosphate isomerase [Oligoflexia bacterium]
MQTKTSVDPIRWENDQLFLLDQRLLPNKEHFERITSLEECHYAIKEMVVRGAPCIGFTAIFGMALWVKKEELSAPAAVRAANYLKSARPTAVNLAFEVDRALEIINSFIKNFQMNEQAKENKLQLFNRLVNFGMETMEISYSNNLSMAKAAENELTSIYGKERRLRIMTHCNTGHLACGKLGTALGVVYHMHSLNRVEKVWVDETRPYLQGSRLTAFELSKQGIDFEIVIDGASSYLMKNKLVDAIFVGADRIVANGDTANKVGTSSLAVVAKHYGVPFYVVAPSSSFDLDLINGEQIDIELRNPDEILKFCDKNIAPLNARALNPSFDVTSSDLIKGIICEKGLIQPNYLTNIRNLLKH